MGFATSLRRPAAAALAALALTGLPTAAHAAATVNKGRHDMDAGGDLLRRPDDHPGLALSMAAWCAPRTFSLRADASARHLQHHIDTLGDLRLFAGLQRATHRPPSNPFVGGFSKFLLAGVTTSSSWEPSRRNEHSGAGLRHLPDDFCLHHASPHCRRAFAERMKFSAVLLSW